MESGTRSSSSRFAPGKKSVCGATGVPRVCGEDDAAVRRCCARARAVCTDCVGRRADRVRLARACAASGVAVRDVVAAGWWRSWCFRWCCCSFVGISGRGVKPVSSARASASLALAEWAWRGAMGGGLGMAGSTVALSCSGADDAPAGPAAAAAAAEDEDDGVGGCEEFAGPPWRSGGGGSGRGSAEDSASCGDGAFVVSPALNEGRRGLLRCGVDAGDVVAERGGVFTAPAGVELRAVTLKGGGVAADDEADRVAFSTLFVDVAEVEDCAVAEAEASRALSAFSAVAKVGPEGTMVGSWPKRGRASFGGAIFSNVLSDAGVDVDVVVAAVVGGAAAADAVPNSAGAADTLLASVVAVLSGNGA